jgi:drug/metabolite transporter (DMT)-like permease
MAAQQRDYRELLVIVAVVLAWGSTFAAIKVGLEAAPPILFAGLRALIGGAVMAVLAGFRSGPPRLAANARDYSVLTVLNVVAFFGLQTLGLLELASGLAAVLTYLQPVLVGVIAWRLLGESMTPAKVAGLLLGFAGIVVVSAGAFAGHVSGPGVGYAAGGAVAWALGTIAFKQAQQRVDAWWAVAVPFLAGGAVLTVAGLAVEGATIDWGTRFLVALGYAALVGTALAWTLWFSLVAAGEASRASAYVFFVPLVSLLIGALFLGEHLGLSLLAGSALVVLGVFLANRPADAGGCDPVESARRR